MKKQPEKPFLESFAEKAGILQGKPCTAEVSGSARKQRKDKHPRLIYLCGAVTNDPHAELKFHLAELYLKARGNAVINPLRVNPPGVEWGDAMGCDLVILKRMMDLYHAIAMLANKMDESKIYWPTVCDIDPADRPMDSIGKRLELSFASDVIPVIRLSCEWDALLRRAIEEKENADGEKS